MFFCLMQQKKPLLDEFWRRLDDLMPSQFDDCITLPTFGFSLKIENDGDDEDDDF